MPIDNEREGFDEVYSRYIDAQRLRREAFERQNREDMLNRGIRVSPETGLRFDYGPPPISAVRWDDEVEVTCTSSACPPPMQTYNYQPFDWRSVIGTPFKPERTPRKTKLGNILD
jgi:hypothetical protein